MERRTSAPEEHDELYAELREAAGKRIGPRPGPRQHLEPSARRGWLIRRALLVADVLGFSVAFVLTEALYPPPVENDRISLGTEFLLFYLTLPLWLLLAKLYGLYDRDEERANHSTADDLVGVFHLVTIAAWLVLAGAWLTGLGDPTFPKLATFWAVAIVAVTALRAAARVWCRRRPTYRQKTIIVGADPTSVLIGQKFRQHREYGIDVVGFVDSGFARGHTGGLPILGTPEALPAIVEEHDVERVVVAFSGEPYESTLDLIRTLKDYDLQIDLVPRLFEVFGANVSVHAVEGIPLLGLPSFRLSRSALLLKRGLDVTVSSLALLLLAPVFGVIAVAIKVDSPGSVFFRQTRMGAGGRPFRIFKLRTMGANADLRKAEVEHLNKHANAHGGPTMFKAPDDPRVTRVGRVLRRFSLDELPQLINVWKGEMSLVGPRPLILDEDRHVADWGRERLRLKPGITGLWQVLGRDDIPFDEMVKLDYVYVTEWSLLNDLKLVLRTIPAVLRPRNAY